MACRILQSPVEMRRLGEACERARVQLVADGACCAAHATANFDGVPLSVSLSREAFEHLAGTAAAAAAAGVSDEVRMVVDVMIRTLEREAATTAVEKAAKLRAEAAAAKERLAALKAKRGRHRRAHPCQHLTLDRAHHLHPSYPSALLTLPQLHHRHPCSRLLSSHISIPSPTPTVSGQSSSCIAIVASGACPRTTTASGYYASVATLASSS